MTLKARKGNVEIWKDEYGHTYEIVRDKYGIASMKLVDKTR